MPQCTAGTRSPLCSEWLTTCSFWRRRHLRLLYKPDFLPRDTLQRAPAARACRCRRLASLPLGRLALILCRRATHALVRAMAVGVGGCWRRRSYLAAISAPKGDNIEVRGGVGNPRKVLARSTSRYKKESTTDERKVETKLDRETKSRHPLPEHLTCSSARPTLWACRGAFGADLREQAAPGSMFPPRLRSGVIMMTLDIAYSLRDRAWQEKKLKGFLGKESCLSIPWSNRMRIQNENLKGIVGAIERYVCQSNPRKRIHVRVHMRQRLKKYKKSFCISWRTEFGFGFL